MNQIFARIPRDIPWLDDLSIPPFFPAPHSKLFPALETYADPIEAARYDVQIARVRVSTTEARLIEALECYRAGEDRAWARKAALGLFRDLREARRLSGMAIRNLAGLTMASHFASKSQKEADDMDARLFSIADRAYANGWQDVAQALDVARAALLRRMHPADRKIAANA
jgi:hypothetical protein